MPYIQWAQRPSRLSVFRKARATCANVYSAGRSYCTRGYRSRKSRSSSAIDPSSFQLSSSMNALQDPTKKPSINSLLNPQESLAHPVGTNHGQNQSSQTSSMFQYGSVPSYHLRAASWDPDDDPHKRRPLNGAHSVDRQYSTLPPTPSPNYGDAHASRLMVRPRIDESSMYTGEGQVWQPKHSHQQQQQHQHAVSGMSYPIVPYSDKRTGISVSHLLAPSLYHHLN